MIGDARWPAAVAWPDRAAIGAACTDSPCGLACRRDRGILDRDAPDWIGLCSAGCEGVIRRGEVGSGPHRPVSTQPLCSQRPAVRVPLAEQWLHESRELRLAPGAVAFAIVAFAAAAVSLTVSGRRPRVVMAGFAGGGINAHKVLRHAELSVWESVLLARLTQSCKQAASRLALSITMHVDLDSADSADAYAVQGCWSESCWHRGQ